MNTNDPSNTDPFLSTTDSGNTFFTQEQQQENTQSESEATKESATTDDAATAALKASKSHQRLRALSTLRSSTAPRDSKLEKTLDLPREQRLGEVKPLTPEEIAAVAKASGTYSRLADPTKTEPHPWHRFFARFIDHLVCGFIATVPPFFIGIAYGICNVPESVAYIGIPATWVLSIIAAIVYEPLMLSMWGTTLGKSMFGIKVRDQRTDEYLTFQAAFVRMLRVLWYSGQVLSIVPVVGFIAPIVGHIMQYKKLVRDRITSYDERMKIRYEHG